jgi:cytochrome c biogenesis factor
MSPRIARVICAVHLVVLAGILVPFALSLLGVHSATAGAVAEPITLISLAIAALLMLSMVIFCVRNQSLTSSERLRWELALLVGGPITSLLYFLQQAKKGA